MPNVGGRALTPQPSLNLGAAGVEQDRPGSALGSGPLPVRLERARRARPRIPGARLGGSGVRGVRLGELGAERRARRRSGRRRRRREHPRAGLGTAPTARPLAGTEPGGLQSGGGFGPPRWGPSRPRGRRTGRRRGRFRAGAAARAGRAARRQSPAWREWRRRGRASPPALPSPRRGVTGPAAAAARARPARGSTRRRWRRSRRWVLAAAEMMRQMAAAAAAGFDAAGGARRRRGAGAGAGEAQMRRMQAHAMAARWAVRTGAEPRRRQSTWQGRQRGGGSTRAASTAEDAPTRARAGEKRKKVTLPACALKSEAAGKHPERRGGETEESAAGRRSARRLREHGIRTRSRISVVSLSVFVAGSPRRHRALLRLAAPAERAARDERGDRERARARAESPAARGVSPREDTAPASSPSPTGAGLPPAAAPLEVGSLAVAR